MKAIRDLILALYPGDLFEWLMVTWLGGIVVLGSSVIIWNFFVSPFPHKGAANADGDCLIPVCYVRAEVTR